MTDENNTLVSIKFESNISAAHLKMILDKLQETNLECNVTFSKTAKIFVLPPKQFLRVEQQDL